MSEEAVVDNVEVEEASAPTEEVIETAPEVREFTMDDYKSGFDDEYLSEHQTDIDKFKSPQEVYKSFREAQKMASKKGDIPKADADENTWKDFYTKLGRPEDPTGYEFSAPENLEVSQTYIDKVAEAALNSNMSKAQAEKFVSEMFEFEAGNMETQDAAKKEAWDKRVSSVSEEWGEAEGEMSAAVSNLVNHYKMEPEQAKAILDTPEANILLGRIAKDFDEKNQVGAIFNSTRAGLDTQKDEIEQNIIKLVDDGASEQEINREQEKLKAVNARRSR